MTSLGDMACADAKAKPTLAAMACLNHLIADALSHAHSCVRYMSMLHDVDVFRFCAIPQVPPPPMRLPAGAERAAAQVMAIATLDELSNNPLVFSGVVKVRKGLALKAMMQAPDMPTFCTGFLKHSVRARARGCAGAWVRRIRTRARPQRSLAAKIPAVHATQKAIADRAMIAVEVRHARAAAAERRSCRLTAGAWAAAAGGGREARAAAVALGGPDREGAARAAARLL